MYSGPSVSGLTFRVGRQSDVPKIWHKRHRGQEVRPAYKEVLANGLEPVARVPTTRAVVRLLHAAVLVPV
jgi:hypothetical protein